MPATTIEPQRYTPDHERRRRDRAWAFLRKEIGPKEILLGLAAVVLALGWTVNSPSRQIAQLHSADSALDQRVTINEKTIASLAEQQRFTNYMLCVNARRTDPASAPPDCTPIIEARRGK